MIVRPTNVNVWFSTSSIFVHRMYPNDNFFEGMERIFSKLTKWKLNLREKHNRNRSNISRKRREKQREKQNSIDFTNNHRYILAPFKPGHSTISPKLKHMQLAASKKQSKTSKRKLNKKRTSKRNKLKMELKDVSSGRSEEDEKESENNDGLGVEHLIKVLEFSKEDIEILRDAFVKVKEVTTDVAIVRTAMTMLVIVTKNVQFLSFPLFFFSNLFWVLFCYPLTFSSA